MTIVPGTTLARDSEQFALALKGMSRNLWLEMQKANRAIGHVVAADAKRAATSRQAAKASQSIKVTTRKGGVQLGIGGSTKYAFAAGAEFGARKYNQFPPWRGNQFTGTDFYSIGVGYWLHPTIRQDAGKITDLYTLATYEAATKAGIRMRPSTSTLPFV